MYSIKDFLKSKDIIVADKKGTKLLLSELDEYNILKHIELLTEFQQRVKISEGFFLLCFPSKIGKEMEELKVQYKRFKRLLDMLEGNNTLKDKEKLHEEGKNVIKRCESCFNIISKEEYMGLIRRSMKENEVCIGNPMEYNLFYDDGIKIYDTSEMAFNLLEWDCINYLSKLKRRGVKCNWYKMIDLFIENNKLDEISKKYILAMLSFPYEFFRVINKFKTNSISEKELINKIENSKIRDGEMLI